MMRKLLCFLLCLLLVPTACAQEAAPFVPGSATQAMFAQALKRGEMILANLNCGVVFNETAAEVFEEDAAMLSALSDVLAGTTLTAGIGQIEDGIRLYLAGQYAAGEQAAALDLMADLTSEGVSLMSGILPNERLSARWETLAELAGVGPEELAPVAELSEADTEAMINELAAQAETTLTMLSQIAAPYGETILAHLSALPMDLRENVPAEAGFPAAAMELNISITDKAMGNLIVDLATQISADATLCALIDAALANSGEEISTVQLCQAVSSTAAEALTDESSPLSICIGMNGAGDPIYLNIVKIIGETTAILSIVDIPDENAPERMHFTFDLLTSTEEGGVVDGVSIALSYPLENTEANALDLQGTVELYYDGENTFASEFSLLEGAILTEDSLNGRAGAYSLLFAADDGFDVFYSALNLETQQSETAAHGEQSVCAGELVLASGEVQIPTTFQINTLTDVQQGVATYSTFINAPQLGIDEFLASSTAYAAAFEPDLSAVTEIALETASPEELDALTQRAAQSLEELINTLAGMLPAALTGSTQTTAM